MYTITIYVLYILYVQQPFMNLIGGNQGNQDGRQPPNRDEQVLARIFMAITLLIILWLILS